MSVKITRLRTLPIGCDGVTVYKFGFVRLFKLHTPIVWWNGRLQRWRSVWAHKDHNALRIVSRFLIAGNYVLRIGPLSFSGLIPVRRP